MKQILCSALVVLCCAGAAQAQQPPNAGWAPMPGVNWQQGPGVGKLGTVATIQIPKGFLFTDAKGAKTFMEALGNPPGDRIVGLIQPINASWFTVFEYDPVGYVKDDEKNSLDADKILETIKKGTAEANKERAKRGWGTVTVVGWQQKPVYNPQSHNLEWGVIGEGKEGKTINYNTRLLGRGGVMAVKLVDGMETFQISLAIHRRLLGGFQFVQGQTYAEYRKGDKLAKYGLTALIAGGAAAVALKTGLFRWLWKGLVLVVVAVGGLFKKLFGGGRRSQY